MLNPLLETENLLVGYTKDAPVCAPITVAVRPGEAVAVVGENGTGKSTLLRTVTGLLAPLSGRVRVLGRAADERSRRQRAEVAADLGDDVFLPALTAREHLELIALGHGVDDAQEQVDELLEDMDLTSRARVAPDALSSGQRRRLLLASVLVRPFRLLILDEPEQRLDAGMRDRLGAMLRAEVGAGAGVLLVTHDPALVRACATSALVLGAEGCAAVTPGEAAARIEAM